MKPNQTGILVEDATLASRVAECLRLVGEDAVVLEAGAPVPDGIGRLIGTPTCLPRGENRLPAIQLGGVHDPSAPAVVHVELPLRLHGLLAALHATERMTSDAISERADQDAARLLPDLIGTSTTIRRLRMLVARAAETDAPVVLVGGCGVGHLDVATALHRASGRASGPLVPLDCASIAAEALDSELFGHEKRAFPGALSRKVGRFELASGGTLYLEAVHALPLGLQSKLIRAINERAIERLGGSEAIPADVRIVAATDVDLELAVEQGAFRADLYRALCVYPIEVPALRDRREDIARLIVQASSNAERRHGVTMRYHPATLAALAAYPWPRNLRELELVVERLALAHPNEVIGVERLPARYRAVAPQPGGNDTPHRDEPLAVAPGLIDPDRLPLLPVNGIDLREYLTRLERSLIQQALNDTHHVVARAADRLHIRRTTLVEKMRKYGLTRAGESAEPINGGAAA